MDTTRRSLLAIGGLAPFITVATLMQRVEAGTLDFGSNQEEATRIATDAMERLNNYPGYKRIANEEIAMVCYEGMTMLDLVGPQYFFACMLGSKVHLVSQDPDLKPIMGDTGFAVVPTMSMADCPKDLDILFVPGGLAGTGAAMKDDTFMDFIADRGARAKHVTSVCTGSLVLGQAGLLHGKRATSHWAVRHLLPEFGATEVNARVVQDGTITTGAGVSAGIDFALTLVKQLRGQPYAEAIQLLAEYAPEPPVTAGTPEKIEPELGRAFHEMLATAIFEMKEAARPRRL